MATLFQKLLFPTLLVSWFGLASAAYLPGLSNPLQGADLNTLYLAAVAVSEGRHDLIYLMPDTRCSFGMPEAWYGLANRTGAPGTPAIPYLYPPIWAGLLAPITELVSIDQFSRIALYLNIGMLGFTPLISAQLLRLPACYCVLWYPACFVMIFGTLPFQSALFFNQLQIFVVFLILASLLAHSRRFFILAGILLGVAAAIKIFPAVFGLLFLLSKNWRAAWAATLTGLALLCIGLFGFGLDLHLELFRNLSFISHAPPLTSLHWSFEASVMELYNWTKPTLSLAGGTLPLPQIVLPTGILVLSRIVGLLVLGLLSVIVLRAQDQDRAFRVAAFCLAMSLAIFGPIGWSHYFMLPMLLLPALLQHPDLQITVTLSMTLCAAMTMPILDNLSRLPSPIQLSVILPCILALLTIVVALWQLKQFGSPKTEQID